MPRALEELLEKTMGRLHPLSRKTRIYAGVLGVLGATASGFFCALAPTVESWAALGGSLVMIILAIVGKSPLAFE